jgi:pyruvate formate lyase activating enzyme
MSRRAFLQRGVAGTCGLGLLALLGQSGRSLFSGLGAQPAFAQDEAALLKNAVAEKSDKYVAEARFYDKLPELKVKCMLCPRECQVANRERGYCGVRENHSGEYKTLVYNRPCTATPDPIEKKPLFHFLPGSAAYSIATAGCNIECKFCQNWQISQFRPEQVASIYLVPEDIVSLAKQNNCKSIAYTYSEPVIFYEYMYDIAALGKKQGVYSVIVSNGYINEKPMRELCKVLTAVKIDFKAFTEKFYHDTCSGELQPVLKTLDTLADIGIWTELVVLIVPTLNDSEDEIRDMSKWIVAHMGKNVPVHFTRFHPTYKIRNLPSTPVKTLERSREIAMAEGIHYAYVGNIWGHKGENTFCPKCSTIVVERYGYRINAIRLNHGKCEKCGELIPGLWTEDQIHA